jgi:hypothetical protein
VALAGADAQPIVTDGEALLVVLGDDAIDLVTRQRLAMLGALLEQRGDLDPTLRVERQADRLGVVARRNLGICSAVSCAAP